MAVFAPEQQEVSKAWDPRETVWRQRRGGTRLILGVLMERILGKRDG